MTHQATAGDVLAFFADCMPRSLRICDRQYYLKVCSMPGYDGVGGSNRAEIEAGGRRAAARARRRASVAWYLRQSRILVNAQRDARGAGVPGATDAQLTRYIGALQAVAAAIRDTPDVQDAAGELIDCAMNAHENMRRSGLPIDLCLTQIYDHGKTTCEKLDDLQRMLNLDVYPSTYIPEEERGTDFTRWASQVHSRVADIGVSQRRWWLEAEPDDLPLPYCMPAFRGQDYYKDYVPAKGDTPDEH